MAETKKYIIITGPESTGKTTLAENITQEYNCLLLPEFAREYIVNLKRKYNYKDITDIANHQIKQFEDVFGLCSQKPIIFDTFLIITKIWMIWNSGKYEKRIDEVLSQTKDALYLLCYPDIEWIKDDVRENGGEARLKLFQEYEKELISYNLNYVIVKGIGDSRLSNAKNFVKTYLEK
ncbi:MAG: ATP-binding protein [Bacteroidales bacterium]|nr:ATP-binding protein [Bacteroidales bacterium]MBN2818337.1 ATP-binding protein [Bacteroidales bacterium]